MRASRILIVDDNPMIVDLLALMITADKNYIILKAYDGEEALDVAGRAYPDLMILDVMMPKMNGYEVLETLKRSSVTKNIPVILTTALNSREENERGYEAGADVILNKPVNRTELITKVQSLLSMKDDRRG